MSLIYISRQQLDSLPADAPQSLREAIQRAAIGLDPDGYWLPVSAWADIVGQLGVAKHGKPLLHPEPHPCPGCGH